MSGTSEQQQAGAICPQAQSETLQPCVCALPLLVVLLSTDCGAVAIRAAFLLPLCSPSASCTFSNFLSSGSGGSNPRCVLPVPPFPEWDLSLCQLCWLVVLCWLWPRTPHVPPATSTESLERAGRFLRQSHSLSCLTWAFAGEAEPPEHCSVT